MAVLLLNILISLIYPAQHHSPTLFIFWEYWQLETVKYPQEHLYYGTKTQKQSRIGQYAFFTVDFKNAFS